MIRILLADDHRIFREGLSALIEDEADMEIIGQAGDGRAAVRMAQQTRPHVVVLDIGMPGMNGIEACRQIKSARRETRVVALSMQDAGRFVGAMFAAGADGYLLKSCASDELIRAIRAVHQGLRYICPPIAGTVLDDYLRALPQAKPSAFERLTEREREVLQLVAEGQSTQQVATTLSISPKTAHTHRTRVMDKLGVHSVAELTKYAVREGLTDL